MLDPPEKREQVVARGVPPRCDECGKPYAFWWYPVLNRYLCAKCAEIRED